MVQQWKPPPRELAWRMFTFTVLMPVNKDTRCLNKFTFTLRAFSRRFVSKATYNGFGRHARCLSQGHLDTTLGGARDRTSTLPVTRQPALAPEQSRMNSISLSKEGTFWV